MIEQATAAEETSPQRVCVLERPTCCPVLTWQPSLDLGEMDLAWVHIDSLAGALLFSLCGLLVFLSLLLSLMPPLSWEL